MAKKQKFENLEITTYGREGADKYFKTFSENLSRALQEGNRYFELGRYIYEIYYAGDGIDGKSYAIEKYNKSDCFEEAPGSFIIDAPTRMYHGTIVANVWRYNNAKSI